jgi:hypothetical protein
MLAVTLAGCGGGGGKTVQQSQTPTVTTPPKTVALGKQAYNRTMTRLGRQLAASVERLFPLVEGQPGSDISKESVAKLERTRAVVTNVMTRVAGIAPPTPVRAEHKRLLNGLSALGAELDKLIEVEEKGASNPFGTYARFASLRTIAKARAAIEKKGYTIG